MNEETQKKIAQDVFDTSLTESQYGLSPVPYHTHNGIDSALVASFPNVFVLKDLTTVLTDASLSTQPLFTLTTTQNFTMANPTGSVNGQRIIYKIKQDSTGSRVITWGSNFRGSNDVALPVLTTTANYVDYVGFIYDSSVAKWNCLAVNRGFAT